VISLNRISTFSEPYVEPGGIATFYFPTYAPPTTLYDKIQPVLDNIVDNTSTLFDYGSLINLYASIKKECDCKQLLWEQTLDCICETNPVLCFFCLIYHEECIAWWRCPTTIALEGTYLEGEIKTLIEFRDDVLNQTDDGRQVIDLYYKYGPEVAAILIEDDNIKQIYQNLVSHFLPLIKGCILGGNDWENKTLTSNELLMLKQFNNALMPYASKELLEYLSRMDVALNNYHGETIQILFNEIK